MKQIISITACQSISPLGNHSEEIWNNYQNPISFIQKKKIGENQHWVACLPKHILQEIENLKKEESKYKDLDNSVLYAILAARKTIQQAKWNSNKEYFGINIGSSRGATTLFEKHFSTFLATKKSPVLASPTTTLGNISSWVAHDLQSEGPEISHSITCSTALHAVLNGIAWLKADMVQSFLVGGSEASLTPFTIAQMQSLKIYSEAENTDFPCKALDFNKTKNTMVLGEGASFIAMEKGKKENALAYIIGYGFATEILTHNISISTSADCFQKSMRMALKNSNLTTVDAIVMHAPGTIKGDLSEKMAIEKVFGNQIPFCTTNKWKIGHTLGASGTLSIEMAILMLQNQQLITIPYLKNTQKTPKKIETIMVNAVGFGGNAVSVILQRKQ